MKYCLLTPVPKPSQEPATISGVSLSQGPGGTYPPRPPPPGAAVAGPLTFVAAGPPLAAPGPPPRPRTGISRLSFQWHSWILRRFRDLLRRTAVEADHERREDVLHLRAHRP